VPKYEKRIKAGKKTYIVRYTTRALLFLEEKLGFTVAEMEVKAAERQLGFKQICTLFWAGLEGHRMKVSPDGEAYVFDDIPEILDAAGGLYGVVDVLMDAIQSSEAVGERPPVAGPTLVPTKDGRAGTTSSRKDSKPV
jgi:hypothetical protein